jgi:hypothetical protein
MTSLPFQQLGDDLWLHSRGRPWRHLAKFGVAQLHVFIVKKLIAELERYLRT